MIKTTIALITAFLIGAACRWFDVPVPAPPKLLGALLVLAMTLGYLVTDGLIGQRAEQVQSVNTEANGRRLYSREPVDR